MIPCGTDISKWFQKLDNHISNIRMLKPTFVGVKKKVTFIKKLFESFKMSTHMTYLQSRKKIILSD